MSVSRETIAAIRFGYGFQPGLRGPSDAGDLLRELSDGAQARLLVPGPSFAERHAMLAERREALKRNASEAEQKRLVKRNRAQTVTDAAARLTQRAYGHGLFERMTSFWMDHFTVAAKSPVRALLIPVYEPEAIRPHVMGHFADMLVAVSRHAAMLDYLDQRGSVGPNSKAGRRRDIGLNENLAREVLELHTLGVGGAYTQRDVRELAELLTGYGFQPDTGEFRFVSNQAEPGTETVLGRTYGRGKPDAGEAEEALRDLARHPDTARHIARKLAVHFVSDTPDDRLVRRLESTFRDADGHLPSLYAELLEHPSSWETFGAKVKQPMDFLVSCIRATGQRPSELKRGVQNQLVRALRQMNQPIHGPPGPDGWPEAGEAWITPQGLASRLEFASLLGNQLAKDRDLDPRKLAEDVLRDALRPGTAFAIGGAEARWEGFALIFASPEFNRR
ncbi:MAG: DUF1800 domain-containing protein [Pseudomonadota bacterium]